MAAGTSPASAVGNAPMRSRARWPSAAAASCAFGELEALGDGVGVLEQDLALAGEPQAAGLAVEAAGRRSRVPARPTWLETDGWDSASSRAARENERWCATARKVSTRLGSIVINYRPTKTMI